jgi:hypothetical protein
MHKRRKREGPRKKNTKAQRRKMKYQDVMLISGLSGIPGMEDLMSKMISEDLMIGMSKYMDLSGPSSMSSITEAKTKMAEVDAKLKLMFPDVESFASTGAKLFAKPLMAPSITWTPEIAPDSTKTLQNLVHAYQMLQPHPHADCNCRRCELAGRRPAWVYN